MSDGAIRGLATVALLKVNYDARIDHLDLYTPFVLDTLRAGGSDDFLPEDLAAEIASRQGLEIPVDALRILLNRTCKKGYLRREYGRFFRNADKPIDVDLVPQREAIEREHRAVATQFIEFARAHRVQVRDEEEALRIILDFLEANEVAILVEPESEHVATVADQHTTHKVRTVALFVRHILRSDPTLAEYVQRILEGLVLENALLLTDINFKKRQFKALEVFFDTKFLFRALRLAPDPYVTAAREALRVLRQANAQTSVFSATIDEMDGVLAAMERLLGTSIGIRQIRPTELGRFLVSRHYQPGDVAEARVLLRKNIGQLGLTIRALPARIPRYVLGEKSLARCLMREDQTEIDARVDHDVNVVAAILTLRAGRLCHLLDEARAIFATITTAVVRNVALWYRTEGAFGIPPVIHQTALSNVAWLKNPKGPAARLKKHELVALCAAALHPTDKMWRRFTEELRRLKASGNLSSDEEVAALTSHLIDRRLSEIADEEDVDAETVQDVIDRVKEEYAEEGLRVAHKAIEEKEKEVAAEASRAHVALERARRSEEQSRQHDLRIIQKAEGIARLVGFFFYWGLGVIVLVAMLVGSTSLASGFHPVVGVFFGVGTAVAVFISFLSSFAGISVKDWRRRVEYYLSERIRTWWLAS